MKEILGLVPSKEQWGIINAIGRKENTSVEAVAGASKTTTLMMAMKHHSNMKFMVLTFMSALNKGMQQECLDNGIHNAAVSTVHSLAYKEIIGKERRYTIGGYVEYKMVADYSKLGFYTVTEAKKMYEDWLDNTEPVEALPKWAQRMHKFIMSRDRISHQMYFKAYILKILKGEVSFDQFDYVVVDECLPASAKVKLANGDIKSIKSVVEDLQNGKTVYVNSFNRATKKIESKRASNPIVSRNRDIVTITTAGVTKLQCTPNHKILTTKGYKRADELQKGDLLIKENATSSKSCLYLNEDQKQILLGSAFGDGSITLLKSVRKDMPKNVFRLRLTQGEKQLRYLKWKLKAFNALNTLYQGKSGYTGKMSIWHGFVGTMAYDRELSIKTVMSDIEPLGLAVWMMDDGSMNRDKKTCKLHSNNLSKEDNEYVIEMLLKRFNIQGKLRDNGRGYWEVSFSVEATRKMLEVIGKFIHKDLEYKFGVSNTSKVCNKFEPYGVEAVYDVQKTGNEDVYDFEVKDNHNFLTGRSSTRGKNSSFTVVHNCNDASRGMAQILKSCGVNTIMLGDPHQSVLGFTLKGYSAYQDEKLLSKYTRYPLSQSFRCSPEVAKYAKAFLNTWLDPELEFKGFAGTVKFADKSYMVLCRTNAGMLKEMVKLMEKGKSFKCNKPLRDLFVPVYQLMNINANVGKVRASDGTVTAEDLIKAGMRVKKGTELCTGVEYYFNGGAKDSGMKFAKYVKRYMSNEFMVAASIIAEHAKTKGAIKRLEERIKSHMSQRSKITVLTVSSSKGMTATRVSISGFRDYSDILLPLFKPEMDMADETEQRYKHITVEELLYRLRNGTSPEEITAREEMNLLYVAITRCRIGFSFSKNDFDPNILLSPKLVVEGLNKELDTLSTIMGRR